MKNGLTVEDVMRDLVVCETTVYRIFKRKDFPANRLTRPFTIEKEAYSEWKKQRREKKIKRRYRMQIKNTINKSVTVATVFGSMMNNKICITVSKLATFFNVLLGTYTITAQKINEMLCIADFQRIASDDEVKKLGTVAIKYVPTNLAKEFVKFETIVKNNIEITSLIWNPSILWEILIVDFNQDVDEIVDNILFNIVDYQLINIEKDEIDMDILKENIKFLKKKLQEADKDE